MANTVLSDRQQQRKTAWFAALLTVFGFSFGRSRFLLLFEQNDGRPMGDYLSGVCVGSDHPHLHPHQHVHLQSRYVCVHHAGGSHSMCLYLHLTSFLEPET